MNKASGGDGIPVKLFQILKDDAVKVLHSNASKFGKLSSGHRTGKGQFSFQSQRKAMPKNAQTTAQLQLISHASKVMLKILQARLQQYVNRELPDVQAGFRKGRGTRDQSANIHWIIEKARENQPRRNKGAKDSKSWAGVLSPSIMFLPAQTPIYLPVGNPAHRKSLPM